MRGLRKGQPPKNVSPDGQEARTWQQAELDLLNGLWHAADPSEHARAAFDALDKPKLRAVMYREQGFLCVYCERRISEDSQTPRIDHWRLLSEEPDLALHWKNLYLSCANSTTCDCWKRDKQFRADPADPDLPWPVNYPYERCVGFTSLGEAYVRTDAPLNDAQRRALALALGVPHDDTVKENGVLNLNDPSLIAARMAALKGERERMERDFKNRTATPAERTARAASLRNEPQLRDFISIRVRWLEKSLGKAR